MHALAKWIETVLVPALGPSGLFAVAFLDSSFLGLPDLTELLLVAASIGRPGPAWPAVTLAALGSLAGCSALWWLGRRGGEALLVRRVGLERAARARAGFERWGAVSLAATALLPPPLPFKPVVLAAGVLGWPFARFAATIFVFRLLRYTLWSLLGALYGRQALALLHDLDAWSQGRWPLVAGAGALAALLALSLWRLRRACQGG